VDAAHCLPEGVRPVRETVSWDLPASSGTKQRIPMNVIRVLVVVSLLAGCQGRNVKVDNPVVGPPPPRRPVAQRAYSRETIADAGADPARTSDDRGVEQVSGVDSAPDGGAGIASLGEVAARVNGTPIFVSDVLEPYAGQLARYHEQVARQYGAETAERGLRKTQHELVKRDLPEHIEQALVVDAVMGQLDAEKREKLDEQLDKFFADEVGARLKQHNVASAAELDAKLQAEGSSLAAERRAFGRRLLASQYVREKIGSEPRVSRAELLQEYQSRVAEYTQPDRVKWQQIQIAHAKHGGKDQARRVADALLGDLRSGTSFDEVVRRHAEGPGGVEVSDWDWTQPESVSDTNLRQALEELPAGQVSTLIEGPKAFLIVKIRDKQAAHRKPFEEVQDELRKKVQERTRKEAVETVVQELRASAVIETMFDGAAEAPSGESGVRS
jgi:parvulin-like peptidyl-prolyl isomerase